MSEEQSIRKYILENFLFTDDDSELNNSDSFLDSGIIDSTGILEVISFLEENFGIKVEDDEMVPENLDSVDNILAYLASKKS